MIQADGEGFHDRMDTGDILLSLMAGCRTQDSRRHYTFASALTDKDYSPMIR
jgi:hypothetical protein